MSEERMPNDRNVPYEESTTAPFLEPTARVWAMRSLSTLLILIFASVLIGSFVIQLPETVSGHFELVPVHGADPMRAPRAGSLVQVDVLEGQVVAEGQVLFRLRSESAGDRSAELRTLEARNKGALASLENARAARESGRLADAEELGRLENRVAELRERLVLQRDGLAIAADMLARQRKLFEGGLLSQTEFSRQELALRDERIALEELEADLVDADRRLGRQRHEAEATVARHREEIRRLEEEIETTGIRIGVRRRGGSLDEDGSVGIEASCDGTILNLQVQSAGAFVRQGDVLAEIACAAEPLRARLTIPQTQVALVEPGQDVKLLYEAFPFERYGVRYATVSSISPAGVETEQGRVFRALAQIEDEAVRVRGRDRPLLSGMGGVAKIIVAHRSVASFILEPLRRLAEATESRSR